MKVLVTGATGFLGGYVISELLDRGVSVVASSSGSGNAEGKPWFSRVQHKPLDLQHLDTGGADYYEYFERPDILIHLAWEGLPNYKDAFHINDNLPRHQAFLENLVRNGLRHVNVTGTCLEYGMQEGMLEEEMPVLPDNPYAIAKNELRLFLEKLRSEIDFSFKWLRLFYMYGKGQGPKSLLSQLEKALSEGASVFNMSGGEQIRDFLPVEKMAHYIVAASLQTEVKGVINCCSGHPVSVNELVEDYLKKEGKQIRLNKGYYPYPDYEPMAFWGKDEKIRKITANER